MEPLPLKTSQHIVLSWQNNGLNKSWCKSFPSQLSLDSAKALNVIYSLKSYITLSLAIIRNFHIYHIFSISGKGGKKSKLHNPIHIGSKSILVLIHLNGFILNSNPYFWILNPIHLIGYGLDTFLDNPNCILGWVLTWPDPSWAKTIQVDVEQSKPEPMLNHSGLGRCRVSGPKSSRPGRGRFRAERAKADIAPSGPRSTSSQAGPGWCWVERARAWADLKRPWDVVTDPYWCWVERTRADVESSRPGPMSIRAGSGRCHSERTQADVESYRPGLILSRKGRDLSRVVRARANVDLYGPGPMLSCTGLGWCGVVRARVDVESYGPRSMLSRTGLGRSPIIRARVDVESYGPGSMLSRTNPSRCRVERTWADLESYRPGPI